MSRNQSWPEGLDCHLRQPGTHTALTCILLSNLARSRAAGGRPRVGHVVRPHQTAAKRGKQHSKDEEGPSPRALPKARKNSKLYIQIEHFVQMGNLETTVGRLWSIPGHTNAYPEMKGAHVVQLEFSSSSCALALYDGRIVSALGVQTEVRQSRTN